MVRRTFAEAIAELCQANGQTNRANARDTAQNVSTVGVDQKHFVDCETNAPVKMIL